jgi:hypothetical protein
MKIRSVSLVAAALLPMLAVPALSHADADRAFDSCVKAFVSANIEKERPLTVHRIDANSSPLSTSSRGYKIELTAVGKHTGKQIAVATCIADRNGVVLSMNGKPTATTALAEAQANAR